MPLMDLSFLDLRTSAFSSADPRGQRGSKGRARVLRNLGNILLTLPGPREVRKAQYLALLRGGKSQETPV